MNRPSPASESFLWSAVMPAAFVLLWSTGFIGAKLGRPYAEPLTFLSLRFALATGFFLVLTLATRAPWPGSWREGMHIAVAGLLLQGLYLTAVFIAIARGAEAGVTALIVCIQPLLVAAASGPLLGEPVSRRQWLGLALGLGGVALVVWHKLQVGLGTPLGFALSLVGLFALTAATLYQKRFCAQMPLRSGNLIQFAVTGILVGLLAWIFESNVVVWSGEFVFALGWLVIVLSMGTFTLLYVLVRRGAAAKVASLFFLVPASTAVVAWLLFDETFEPIGLLGVAIAVLGVALVNLAPRPA